MQVRRSASIVVLATASLLAACSSESTSTATPAPAATTVAPVETAAPAETTAPAETSAPAETTAPAATGGPTLTITDFTFSAATVAAGEALTVTNADQFPHTVTDSGGSFVVRLDGGASETLTIDAPGSYSIVCEIHPSMAGTIVVS
jgi:plastocyanin